jgi:hypothetical protein
MTTIAIEISAVRALIALQRQLVGALRLAYPGARDLKFLLEFPKTGEVTVGGEMWRFDRHGAGVAFTSLAGVVVDVHRCVEQPDVVDAWRLCRYLETSGAVGLGRLEEAAVEAELRALSQQGKLNSVNSSGGYRPSQD